MPLKLKRTVLPKDQLVSTDDGIQYFRVPGPVSAAERNLVDRALLAAFDAAEIYTRRALRAQTWQLFLDAFPRRACFELPWPPVRTATISYKNLAGDENVDVDADAYQVDTVSEPAVVKLKPYQSWPVDCSLEMNSVVVEFACGYIKETNPIPDLLLQAIMQLANHFYESRNPVVVGAGGLQAVEVPINFQYMFDHYRVLDYHDYLEGR